MMSEIMDFGPKIHRLDFIAEVEKNGEIITLILECQSELPNDEDIRRFFQYVSSFRVFKKQKVELYILLTKEASYTEKEFVINDECTFVMKVISLKKFKASEIIKNIEDKFKTNSEITEYDIASLQLIAYTSYEEPILEILKKALMLVNKLKIERNEKEAIIYILDVLSANMLEEKDKNKFMETRDMMINPRDEYITKKAKQEGMKKGREKERDEVAIALIKKGMSLKEISEVTKLTEKQIENLNGTI